MRELLLLLSAAVLALGSPAGAADETPAGELHASAQAMKKELTGVIEAQLAAFRRDDYPKAYTFAAAEIKGQFGVIEFEAMVRKGYPAIAHSGVVEFGLSFDTGEEAVVDVRIEDLQKQSARYQYHLVKQGGVWKIGGVSEVRPSAISV